MNPHKRYYTTTILTVSIRLYLYYNLHVSFIFVSCVYINPLWFIGKVYSTVHTCRWVIPTNVRDVASHLLMRLYGDIDDITVQDTVFYVFCVCCK